MKSRIFGFVGAGFFFLLLCFSPLAEARVSVGLSIGTSFGYRYPGCYYGYPYYPWPGGYYTGPYRHFPGRHYWPRHSSGLGIWIGGYYPVVDRSIVIDRSSVGSCRNQAVTNTVGGTQLSEAMRKKTDEQLKILETGDKEKRLQAIHDLAVYSFDIKIRRALEKVLLSDPDPEVRKEVALSFGRTENQLVLLALTEAKDKDPERDVRQTAYRAIIMIKGY